jgi:hypothetical protein
MPSCFSSAWRHPRGARRATGRGPALARLPRAHTPTGAGNGLWTTRPFLKNDLITEYDGDTIDRTLALWLRRSHEDSHVRALNSHFIYIDGLQQPVAGRGGASFANDARDTRANNAVFVCR